VVASWLVFVGYATLVKRMTQLCISHKLLICFHSYEQQARLRGRVFKKWRCSEHVKYVDVEAAAARRPRQKDIDAGLILFTFFLNKKVK